MKKFFLILLACVGFMTSQAQFGAAKQFPVIAGDTLSVTNGFDSVIKKFAVTAGYNGLSIQVIAKVSSGSLSATSRCYLFQSQNGTDYILTDSAAYVSPVAFIDALPYGTKEARFEKTVTPSWYYAVAATCNAGTVVAPIQIWYTLRKQTVTQ